MNPRFTILRLREETHRLVKSQASLEGKKLCDWLDEVVRKELEQNKKKSWGKYDDMRFFK